MKIRKLIMLVLVCIALKSYSQDTTKLKTKTMETVTTTGIFDGKKIIVGNFDRVEVYKINEYCIAPEEISEDQLDSLKGKKVTVTGTLKIIESSPHPAKSSTEGRIYEPYKEPDKKFIVEPVFVILQD